jgi:hypothetical protein
MGMRKKWLLAATSVRAALQPTAPPALQSHEILQRRMERFGPGHEAARGAALESSPQPLDAHLLADGEALEAAWQAELRAMIAARRGGAEALVAARAARNECEAIVGRIEAARAQTLDGLKVKARAQSWRSDGKSVAAGPDEQLDESGWTEMAEMPRYDSPEPRSAAAACA